ncbi:MAG: anhydro-N-acetylmuramic acid kinase [Candidatus Pelagadaptatus aseana]|uniref:anhydro-N-acetylmuramic acid kinase n=1 Tax=Candidatus Pelagadaptatus aseana TaxID=3120508 RepID=UPI0039B2BD14
MANGLYIGLMSGTSVDGIDAALTEITDGNTRLLKSCSLSFPTEIRNNILHLCSQGPNEIARMATLDRQLGELFAQACIKLLSEAQISAANIQAIGSHGQTIRHQPRSTDHKAYSVQIGDPNTIAEITGITTIADFRRRDIAAGGEGAPLVPAFHQATFANSNNNRLILNIGGMANISILDSEAEYGGLDTGPGNVLMDAWIQQQRGVDFDRNGDWARSGNVITPLLQQLMSHPFFAAAPPKSTGRESFNLTWLSTELDRFYADNGITTQAPAEDIQATLLAFTARTIAEAINQYAPNTRQVFCCGGGAFNQALTDTLKTLLPKHEVSDTGALGIAPQQVESAAFAWLAHQTLHQLGGNCPKATGARATRILGGIYQA